MAQEPVRLTYRRRAAEPDLSGNSRKLDLRVIFTDLPKTAAALAAARTMALGLSARITLLVAKVVPYPLPLDAPDVPVEFTEHALASIAPDADVEIYLCRDQCEAFLSALPPDVVVILGARKRSWWPSWEHSLAKMLRHDGRKVLVVTP